MKKWLFTLLSICTLISSAQSLNQNFSVSIVPKEAMTSNQLNSVVGESASTSNIVINTPKSNQEFVAGQSITLLPNAHLTGSVHLKINNLSIAEDAFLSEITYYDGLGRPKQQNAIGQNPENKDIVHHYEYDQFGREEKKYLPLPTNQNTGNFLSNPIPQINSYYQTEYNDTNPYSQERFDNSPLSRVLETASPGDDWKLIVNNSLDHTTKFEHLTNADKEVKRYDMNDDGSFKVSYYKKQELTKTIIKNENWQGSDGKLNTKEIFKDKSGKTISEVNYNKNDGIVEQLITEYVYDDLGRLRYTITPKASIRDFGQLNASGNLSWNYTKLLSSTFSGGGGGSASVSILNGTLKVRGDAGFSSSNLKTGRIAFIHPDIPDQDLGNMIPNVGHSGNYTAYLKDGYLCARFNTYPASVTRFQFSFEVQVGNIAIPTDQEILDNIAFQYQYDRYNRKSAQKTPGKGWEYFVYDQSDNPVLIQDPNLRNQNLWLFTKYDVLGRVLYTGKYSSSKDQKALQQELNDYINTSNNKANAEKRTSAVTSISGVSLNYSNNAFPKTNITELLSINYYDNYSFVDPNKPATPSTIEGQTVNIKAKGLLTSNWVKTIDASTWSKTYTYYDKKGRTIKSYKKNHLNGYTSTDTKLDFRGNVKSTKSTHRRTNSSSLLTVIDRFEYDHAERLLGQYQKINNQPEERIVTNEYNALGNIRHKNIGGLTSANSPLQKISYRYNIRGWLKEINDVNNLNDDLFAYKLNYNEGSQGQANVEKLYDGNIAQTIWKSKHDNLKKAYAYKYDKLGRITNSYYRFNDNLEGQAGGRFELHNVKYDQNGNILSLQRNAYSGVMDNLTYTYESLGGNKVVSIRDSGNNTQGFIDGNTTGDDYLYDDNGNLIKDRNKEISSITYNYLDLVKRITFNNGKSILFTYDASGNKLSKSFVNGSNIYKTDYLGGFQYQQGQLQFFPTVEGYAYKNNNNTFRYAYVFSDHLGNNRLSYSDINEDGSVNQNEIVSKTDYYPMGLIHSGEFNASLVSNNSYKFQNKELQLDNNLRLYDFGSRMYDPSIGRWFNVDPQNQFSSPYLAMGNNPITLVDPDGEEAVTAAIIIGAVVGAYFGGVSANGGQYNPGKWDFESGRTWGYLLGGAVTGAVSGGVGASVAAGGGAFASTMGIVVGSSINSFGTLLYTGGESDFSVSFGVGSYNFSEGKFGYLGKKGNSALENIGYGLGALANVSDVLAGFKPEDVQLNTEKSDAIGHSALTKVGETDPKNSLVSVGPAPGGKWIYNPLKFQKGTNHWKNYVNAGKDVSKVVVKGVNLKTITNYGNHLNKGVNYNLYFSSCVNHTARALTLAGVPSIGIHPFILNAQLYLRSIGARPVLFSHHLINNDDD